MSRWHGKTARSQCLMKGDQPVSLGVTSDLVLPEKARIVIPAVHPGIRAQKPQSQTPLSVGGETEDWRS